MRRDYNIKRPQGLLALSCFFPDEAGKHPAIILGSGWKNSLENNYDFAEELSRATASVVVTFDYMGIGSSEGVLETLSRKDHLDDLVAVYDWVAQNELVDETRIGVNGGSYSGYLAALLTSERPVHSLLLRAPALYADDTFSVANDTDERDPDGYYEGVIKQQRCGMLDSALADYTRPFLVQEREGDEVITPSVIAHYLSKNASKAQKHSILKGAGHKLSGDLMRRSTKECIDWFNQTLVSQRGTIK